MLASIFEWLSGVLTTILPLSPFQQYIDQFRNFEYLGWLNWFVPIGPILGILSAWLAAVASFYLYSIILRWVKVLGD